jgi:protein-tyrosine phosphatase
MKAELSNILERRRCGWASEIVDGQLWLGSGTDAMNLEELQKRNIQHVLNVADDVPNYHRSITYLNLNIQDFGQDCGISRMFTTAFDFLAHAEASGNGVLVHCAAGANRSATIVIAYLMHSRSWTLLNSWNYVRSRRRVVPLKDNRLQLLEFEKKLFNQSNSIEEKNFLLL